MLCSYILSAVLLRCLSPERVRSVAVGMQRQKGFLRQILLQPDMHKRVLERVRVQKEDATRQKKRND